MKEIVFLGLAVSFLAAAQCTTNADCNDNNACTTDSCHLGVCVNTPITCNDNNACTIDTCDAQIGCVNTPRVCNDNNACTTDSCDPQTGNCVFTPINCNYNNACAGTGSCDVVAGCVYANIPPMCQPNQIGYAANLNIGDSVVDLSNNGYNGGFLDPAGAGNICANAYVFDPQEEEVSCCSCLVTPDGLNSLSAKSDLISNVLTPAIPSSVVINLIASTPGVDTTGKFTICNPSTVASTGTLSATGGMLAWGTTLEPNASVGAYSPVQVPFINGGLSPSELNALTTVCSFIQSTGSGFGICNSCQTGALSGTKR
jgi:hypothetical protein